MGLGICWCNCDCLAKLTLLSNLQFENGTLVGMSSEYSRGLEWRSPRYLIFESERVRSRCSRCKCHKRFLSHLFSPFISFTYARIPTFSCVHWETHSVESNKFCRFVWSLFEYGQTNCSADQKICLLISKQGFRLIRPNGFLNVCTRVACLISNFTITFDNSFHSSNLNLEKYLRIPLYAYFCEKKFISSQCTFIIQKSFCADRKIFENLFVQYKRISVK